MPESIRMIFDDGEFDRVVHGSLKEGGDVAFVFKENATKEGHPAVCLTWTVELPDGTPHRAQAVVTARNLINALHAIMGKYSHLAEAVEPDMKPGMVMHGKHKQVAYDAVGVEQVWLIAIEGHPGVIGIGKNRDHAHAVAQGLIDQIHSSA